MDSSQARGEASFTGWLALLCLALTLIYLPALRSGFHFDDFHMVVDNQLIKSWRSLPATAVTPSISSVPVAKGMYRPVLMASYALDYRVGRLNPVGYHLTNLLLHLLVVCLAAGLALALRPGAGPSAGLRAGPWALLGVAIWALHPLHTQPVSYVSARSSVLAAFWMLLAILLFVAARRGRGGWRRWAGWAGSLAAYGLALGSKEIAITLPALLLLVEWRTGDTPGLIARPRRGRSNLAMTISFFLLGGAYLAWRKALIGAVGVVYPARPWGENVRVQLEGVLHYVRLWLWPVGQSIAHPQPDGIGAGPWAGLALLVGAGLFAWRVRKRWPQASFALAWAGIAFLPVAFASSLNLVVAEHHAYLPTLGLAFLFLGKGAAARGVPKWSVPFLLLLAAATFLRSGVWRDGFTLWADAARKAPRSCLVQNNLGLEYEGRGRIEEAFRCYAKALGLAGSRIEEATARNNLGSLYSWAGRPEAAVEQFQICLQLNHFEQGYFYNNLGLAQRQMGLLREAEESYVRALDANPRMVEPYLNLGSMWLLEGRSEEGGRLMEEAVRWEPDHPGATLALGKFYLAMGEWNRAQAFFQRLVGLAPGRPEGHLYLAVTALRMNPPQVGRAHAHLNRAIALGWDADPEFLDSLAASSSAIINGGSRKWGASEGFAAASR